jgi:sugar lactone lactonase YvrE/predicted secreted protein
MPCFASFYAFVWKLCAALAASFSLRIWRSNRTNCLSRLGRLAVMLTICFPGKFSFADVLSFPGVTAVGNTSAAQTVSVTVSAAGQIAAVKVLTTGAPNLDFTISGAGTCSIGSSYFVGQVCNFPVTFQPKYPGQRLGAVVMVDASGNVLGTTSLVGSASGPLALFIPGTIKTVAGSAAWIYRGDGLPATSSSIFLPFGITVDAAGNLYIADSSNDRIRKVDATTNLMSTIAGNGSVGASGDGGLATLASVNLPSSVTIDGAGNIYFADSANNAIRKVDAFTGIITTVAGTLGVQGYAGDGGQATAALLNNPDGIAIDGYGALYIADTGNNTVRRLDLSSGVITAFAGNHTQAYSGDGGNATSASLNSPWGVTVSPSGDVYIADQNNHCIRKVTHQIISTISGGGTPGFSGDGGAGTAAVLNSPSGVVIDVAGNIYIADTGNNRVRKINAATGIITTVAGNGTETFSGDGGAADGAGMYGPYGLVLDGAGDLFIADVFHNRIRMISSNNAQLSFPTMRVNRVSATQNETLENDGNAPLNISAVQPITNAQLDSSVTTCSATSPVASALSCIIGAQFAPTVIGNPVVGSITITSDSQNSPQTIQLSGQVLTLDPSTAVLRTSGSPSALGAPVTFTVTVTSTGVTPTGTVMFLDGTTSIGTSTLNGSGVATLTTASLTLGTHSITASYPGDTNNSPSISNVVSQLVKNGTTVLLQSSQNPSSAQSLITLTATAVGVNGTPTGTMTFLDGTTTIGTATLDGSGVATLNISSLSVGTHKLTASYGGDSSSLPNVSSQLSQVVSKSSTTTSAVSSNLSSTFSTTVTFTATVVSQTAGTPTGTITFKDGSTNIGTATLNGSGIATLSTATLAVGSHSISASYGGDTNNATSTSSLLSQTIVQINTSVALTSDANPSAAGANVHLTATITASLNPSTDPLTGSVVFTDGAATLGTSNVAGGIATLDVAALSIGQHSIVATYSGAIDYAGSSSSPLSQKVQLSPTTGTLTASSNPAIAGKPLTLTATVASSGSMPTGPITFKDASANIGLGTLNAQGIATFTTSSLTAGTHALTAVYAGDTNSQPVTSSLTLVVSQATTAVVLSSSSSPATVGLPLTLRATATGNGATPSGSITFFDGATSIGSSQLDSNGLASLVISSLAVGSHSITAVYSGDTNDATSTSPVFSQIIDKTTTTTVLTSTSTTVSQGTSVQFAAQVSSNAGIPGGTVQFFDGSTLLGTATVNAAGVAVYNVSSLLVGQHNIVAVYSGDANNGASTSTSLTQIVQPITIVGLTSDHNPSSTGASLTFTAGVSGANTIPTGTVTFKDGSSIIGVSTLNGAGVATLTTSALSAGTHLITAAYAGDGNNTASVSSVYTQTVQQATTQTVLTLNSNTANYGSSLPMSATVTGTGGTPTGEVNFLDGATVLGTAHLNAAGTASFSISTLSLGQHTLTAVYNGDTNDATSTSAPQILTIQKDTVSITIASSSNPSLGGLAVSFTTSLQASAGVPTGTVAWNDGAVLLGTTPVSGNGSSSLTTATLIPGQHTITATYSGDSTNGSATSSPLIETIQQATSAITLLSSNNPGLAGGAVTLSVTVTGTGGQPGGPVTITDGVTPIGTITLDANGLGSLTNSSLSAGSHTLVAVYGGDAYHAGSQSQPVAQAILRGTSSSLTSSKNPSLAGDSTTFTATIVAAGNIPVTGTVTFRDGSIVLGSSPVGAAGVATYTTSALATGDHSITASYSGDSLNQPSVTPVLVQSVQTIGTTTTLSSTVSAATVGSNVTLTATVTGSGSSPTGTVNFMDGANLLGPASITAAGVAVFTISSLTPGQHILLAIYQGDAEHLTSTSNPLLQSILQRTNTVVTSATNPSFAASGVTFTVQVSNGVGSTPTGSVHLMDGATSVATSILGTNGSAAFTVPALSVGQHSITAVYDGDAQNFASTSQVLSQSVILHPTTNVLTASSTSLIQGQQLTLTATLGSSGTIPPGGQVIFSSGTKTLGSAALNASGIASLTLAPDLGTYNITATYQGDSVYAGSVSSAVIVNVVEQTNFTITLNPGTLSLQSKQHSTIQLTLKSIQGFTDTIALGCVGLPNAATCTFSANQISLAANGTQTIDLVVDTGSPLTAGGVATASTRLSTGVTLCLLPGGAIFAFIFRRSRKASRMMSGLLAVLIFAVSIAISGCGTLDVNGTPTGSYTFNVTGIGSKTAATQSAPFALTVK